WIASASGRCPRLGSEDASNLTVRCAGNGRAVKIANDGLSCGGRRSRAADCCNQLLSMLNVPKATDKSFAEGKILQSVSEGVGVITFNHPAKHNAMSLDMWEGLGHALLQLRDDPDVRVVIIVGAGDKAFVSGADISQFEETRHNAEASEEYSKRSAAQRALLADYPKPTIACIRG